MYGKDSLSLRARGKLMVTGEYIVLNQATALALPTKLGQTLTVDAGTSNTLSWSARDVNNNEWFAAEWSISERKLLTTTDIAVATTLKQLLDHAQAWQNLNSSGYQVITRLEFDRHWGLGSSSTLVALIAQWTGCDPYSLQFRVFGGSGYDIACALSDSPLLYTISPEHVPSVQPLTFDPCYSDHLFWVYLGQKQNSRTEIARYRNQETVSEDMVSYADQLTKSLVETNQLDDAMYLFKQYEALISSVIGRSPVQGSLSNVSIPFQAKSCGAWGGDFILVATPCGKKEATHAFHASGLSHILAYHDLV